MPQPRHAILFAGCWVASLCATVNAECSLHCPPAMLDVYSLFVALKGLNDNQTGIAVAEVEEKNTAARDLKGFQKPQIAGGCKMQTNDCHVSSTAGGAAGL